jgi:hypothetical protein
LTSVREAATLLGMTTKKFDFEDLKGAAAVLCAWNGGDGMRKTFLCEVLDLTPDSVTLVTERGKIFTRPLPTSVVIEVLG